MHASRTTGTIPSHSPNTRCESTTGTCGLMRSHPVPFYDSLRVKKPSAAEGHSMNDAHPEYEGQLTLATPVDVPSYDACLSWMRDIPQDRAITFDLWARGNFVRRLLYQRANSVTPFLMAASHPTQMRWAFRRLALAGIPVDFVYTGPLSEPRLVKHWHPLDIPVDSGWGYVVFAGTVVESKTDRQFWPVLGEAALMPDSVLQW